MNRRKLASAALVLVIVTLQVGLTGSAVPAEPAATAPEFSATKTLTRTHRVNGADTEVDRRNFSVAVSQTEKLRGNQLINVAWSGAHETLGKHTDPNAKEARFTEYPVVLVECRGDDTAGAPVDPSGCFTQTIDERTHSAGVPFPPWRVDRYAPPDQRAQLVGYPDPRPEGCPPSVQPTARYVPFVAADGTTYRPLSGLPRDHRCGPVLAPEMISVPQPAAPPGNTTYAVSDVNGNGSVKFAVLTGAENASLGCSQTAKCSLVIVPIMGISCDVTGAGVPTEVAEDVDSECQAPGKKRPGEILAPPDEFNADLAVTGVLWWSASNWRNRITVPLHFGTPANVCEAGDNRIPLDVFGSELMTQATTQWAPAVCLNRDRFPFRFRHVQTGEPQAKGALAAGSAAVAMVSTPPPDGYPKPTVNAPIGLSGFAVSYLVDNKDRFEYTTLRLTPRLIAKALTESYPALGSLREVYGRLPDSDPHKALKNNPFDMSTDPEFIALNPDVGNHSVNSGEASATVLALSGTSDVTWALTSYLNADPETRAWLDGTPDPWGMVVHPGYRNIELPQLSWPLLDSFTSPEVDLYSACYAAGAEKIPPLPLGPLVAGPVPTLAISAQRVQYAISNSRTLCQTIADQSGSQVGVQLTTKGRQGPGNRFMLAVTSLADAHFFKLNTAALQSTATIERPGAPFTDATGRVFVAPTPVSMQTAAMLAKPDQKSGSWPVPYDVLHRAEGEQAYPGTMLVYASVPTTGLTADDATHSAQLLRFAVTDGQTPGLDHGQLPPGYVPLTREAGFGHFVDYTLAAADAVAAQQGQVPPVVPGANQPPPPAGAGAGSSDSGSGFGSQPAVTPQRQAPAAGPPPATVLPVPSKTAPVANAGSRGPTTGIASALARWALPIVVIVALAAALIALGTRYGYAIGAKLRARR